MRLNCIIKINNKYFQMYGISSLYIDLRMIFFSITAKSKNYNLINNSNYLILINFEYVLIATLIYQVTYCSNTSNKISKEKSDKIKCIP